MSARKPVSAPFGAWRSTLSAALVARGGVKLYEPRAHGGALHWIEGRPEEQGRQVVVRAGRGDVTPAGFNARTRVHEYGGGSYAVWDDAVYFSNFADQRVYRQRGGGAPVAITPEPPQPCSVRFADFEVAPDGAHLYCVRETHPEAGGEPRNELARLAADGSTGPRALWSESDFVSSPRLSPDGSKLAWIAWDHPNMPWDTTQLWVADVQSDGSLARLHRVASGAEESIQQPLWSPDGVLHFVSDRSGWWNVYRLRGEAVEALAPRTAEFANPPWVFALATLCFLPDGRLVCSVGEDGWDRLCVLQPGGALREVATPYRELGFLTPLGGSRIAALCGSPRSSAGVAVLDIDTGTHEIAKQSLKETLDPELVSEPEAIQFPTAGGLSAHAFFYPPRNPDFAAPPNERPPLLVFSHGGPTSAASPSLNPAIQFWTSRGFAVVDVDYGGSTGYGRAYRNRLRGQWGIVDTQDCINAARYLAKRNLVDGERLAIRGGSAGGYTTLCALTFHDVFAAGASYYGVADVEALARDTHKFESRYLDLLIGPYPETRELYRERSPIHHVDRLSCPLLILQGLEDEVVPPAQAELMVEALAKRGLPHAYLPFQGEQHGFRQAPNIRRALEAELLFYAYVFGFAPADADDLEPLAIRNA